jgi:hypothetical protein
VSFVIYKKFSERTFSLYPFCPFHSFRGDWIELMTELTLDRENTSLYAEKARKAKQERN